MEDYGFTQKEIDTLFFGKKMVAAISSVGDKILEDYGIKSYHLALLRVISSNDGIDQKSIRKTIPFDKSRISVIVRELSDWGFIYDSGSGRSSALHLTDKGKEAVKITPEYTRKIEKTILPDLSAEELDILNKVFEKLNAHLDTLVEKDQL